MNDTQLNFTFPDNVYMENYTVKCKCGKEYKEKRCSIVLEMTIKCDNCGRIINIGRVIK